MKVALVHDWLTGMRGGERCLEILCELFPSAELFTLLYRPGTVSATIARMPIHTSFLQRIPFASTFYRYCLPLFPKAIERFDLTGYDLIVSSSHCVAKGAPTPPGVCHLAYVYTPMRYVWDQYEAYFGNGRAGILTRIFMRLIRHRLQQWDVSSNGGIYRFIAISHHVARRIAETYGASATVVYPPVNWHAYEVAEKDDGFYLLVSAFAPYKRVDLAVLAFNQLGRRLIVIGSGQEERRLKGLAGSAVTLMGWQPDEVVRRYYAGCKALIFPGEEDFGIVPLEAMACGKPVIAYAKGGALETVVPLNPQNPARIGMDVTVAQTHVPTGIFFYEQTIDGLVKAVHLFEQHRERFDPYAIRAHVESFDRSHFKARLRQVIHDSYDKFQVKRRC